MHRITDLKNNRDLLIEAWNGYGRRNISPSSIEDTEFLYLELVKILKDRLENALIKLGVSKKLRKNIMKNIEFNTILSLSQDYTITYFIKFNNRACPYSNEVIIKEGNVINSSSFLRV